MFPRGWHRSSLARPVRTLAERRAAVHREASESSRPPRRSGDLGFSFRFAILGVAVAWTVSGSFRATRGYAVTQRPGKAPVRPTQNQGCRCCRTGCRLLSACSHAGLASSWRQLSRYGARPWLGGGPPPVTFAFLVEHGGGWRLKS
jgi:hypothetical protein